jgi:hypothetical protein
MSLYWNQPHMCYVKWKNGEKPPHGNGTVCTLISVIIKQGAASHIWREFYRRKVLMVNIKDAKWLVVKLANDSGEISSIKYELEQLKMKGNMHNNKYILTLQNLLILKQKQSLFKIPLELHEIFVTVTPTCLCDIKETFKCQMTIFPVNINTSSTWHEL